MSRQHLARVDACGAGPEDVDGVVQDFVLEPRLLGEDVDFGDGFDHEEDHDVADELEVRGCADLLFAQVDDAPGDAVGWVSTAVVGGRCGLHSFHVGQYLCDGLEWAGGDGDQLSGHGDVRLSKDWDKSQNASTVVRLGRGCSTYLA